MIFCLCMHETSKKERTRALLLEGAARRFRSHARADEQTREAFEAELQAVIDAAAEGLEAPTAKARRSDAIVLLSLLAGGVSRARAVNDPAFSEEIAKAIPSSLLRDQGSLHLTARKAGRKG